MIDRRKSTIKRNRQGESVMAPFVLIVTFILILGFMVNGLMRMAASSEIGGIDLSDKTQPFGLYDFTFIVPTEGLVVDEDTVIDYVPYPTHEDPLIFTDEAPDPDEYKYVHIIRNNVNYNPESTDMWEMYSDFISIRRDPHNFVKWGDQWENAAIPFSAFADNYDNETKVSSVLFQLGNSQDALFIDTVDSTPEGFLTGLWGNDFTVSYGWSLFRLEEVDFWSAIAIVLYEELPGVTPVVNWIFHGFVWSSVIFVVFTMATRLTPFLGGA